MSEKTIEGITKIAVKGFKSIAEECEIDVRPLTILAGANSSGKSSIMQPLLMLKQTLEAPYDPGPLLIDGPNVQFAEAEQFLSILPNGERIDRFQIEIEAWSDNFRYSVEATFRKRESQIEIAKVICEIKLESLSSPIRFTLYPEMAFEDYKALAYQHPTLNDSEVFKTIVDTFFTSEHSDVVRRSRCFLSFETGTDWTAVPKLNILESIHLPGLRGNPERTYKLTGTGPQYPGTFENYAAIIIHEWQETKNERLKTIADALHTLGLTRKVSTKKIGDIGIEVQVGRLPRGSTDDTDMVNIADVGIAVSQVLPVLVALIVAEPGRLVYLEQPELHLHPRAQVALARVLADAAKRGVRVVAETHSSLLLLGLQTLIAEGDLSPELVKLHWFSRREDGVTEVNSADLDETGAYGEWPEDFADVSLHAQSSYIKAARSRFIKGA